MENTRSGGREFGEWHMVAEDTTQNEMEAGEVVTLRAPPGSVIEGAEGFFGARLQVLLHALSLLRDLQHCSIAGAHRARMASAQGT